MAQGVITKTGREKLCKAHAGDITLPAITQMAFGSGGVDESGAVIVTTGEEVSLRAELLKKDIDRHTYPETTTGRYSVRLGKEELADQTISEQGLFDAEGDLIAYKTFLPKGKDGDMEFIFDMDEIF
ncbi:MAG: hypothetical protein HFG79_12590 [Lachnospiraceae bacterium]|nr:hypothetical protein [Lachnospiraceae bacterium]